MSPFPILSRTSRATRTRFLAVPFLLAATACNCDHATTRLNNGVAMLTPSGAATDFTRSIAFGQVRVSDVATYNIELHNIGLTPATINGSFQTPSPNFFLKWQPGDGPQATIQPGADYTIELRYQPDAVGPDTTTIIITTTAPSTPQYTINVTGSGAESEIDVCSTDDNNNPICFSTAPNHQLTVNMGLVNPGSMSTKPLIIKDLGGLTLNVTTMAPTSNTSTEFSVQPNQGPVTVATMQENTGYTIQYAPEFGGPEQGVIQINSDDPVNPTVLVYITGTGNAPHLCINPTSVEFGPVPVNTTATQTVTLTSCGTEPIQITDLSPQDVSGPDGNGATPVFGITSPPGLPLTLAPTDPPVTLTLTYSPVGLGDNTGHLNLATNALGQAHGFIPLDGQGVGCTLTGTPNPVNFGMQPTGTTATQQIVLVNSGSSSCNISNLTTSGAPFALVNTPTLPIMLSPGDAQIVQVTFTPTTQMASQGTFTASSNATGGAYSIPLEGTGEARPPCFMSADPASITFTGVASGTSATLSTKVTQLGTAMCNIVGEPVQAVGSTPASDFTVNLSGNAVMGPPGLAPVTLGPNQSVTLSVTFKPSTTAQENVNVAVEYCNSNSPTCFIGGFFGGTTGDQTLLIPVIAGTIPPAVCVSPPSLNFGTVGVGQSKDLTTTITSCGAAGSVLVMRGLKFDTGTSPSFSLPQAINLPENLPAGQSISVDVHYAPTTTNGDFGNLAVMSNDPNNPKVEVPLEGNAANVCSTQLACSPAQLIFPTTPSGSNTVPPTTESLSATCLNVGTAPVTITGVSFSGSSSPAFTANTGNLPQTIAPGNTLRVQVNFTPQSAGTDTGTLVFNSNSCAPATVNLVGPATVPSYPPCLPPQTFEPTTKWYWTGGAAGDGAANVAMSPGVANLQDTNGDGLININDIPTIVFTACQTGNCCLNCLNPAAFDDTDFSGIGSLYAIRGDTGAPVWSVTAANQQLTAVAQIAIADLDGDNIPEVIAVQHTFHQGTGMEGLAGKYISGVLLVFDHNGNLEFQTEEWTGDPNNFEFGSAPAVADLDGDGVPEIVFERTVFNYDGTVKYTMGAPGGWGHGSFPTLQNLGTSSGDMDIVSGAYVWDGPTGNLVWKGMPPGAPVTCDPTSITACATTGGMCDPISNTCMLSNGPTMVLGFPLNGSNTNSAVVVLRDGAESMKILDGATGAILAQTTWPPPGTHSNDPTQSSNGICPAAMSAADLDGDGTPEIIVPSGDFLYTFKFIPPTGSGQGSLQQVWKYPINDYQGQCGASGSAAFDFNGNGIYDVVYHDTQHIYVLQGSDGSLLYEAPRESDTIFETPVIADIDNTGHASFIMTNDGNDELMTSSTSAGVKALGNTGNNWPDTRHIWSDHAYHITEIDDGATVPPVEAPVWKYNNNWRAQNPFCTPTQ